MNEINLIVIAIIFGVLLIISILTLYFYFSGKLKLGEEKINNFLSTNTILKTELDQEKNLHLDAKERITELEREKATLYADLKNLRVKYQELTQNEATQIEKFENIANRVLRRQSSTFTEEQKVRMQEILDPLKTKIDAFQQKVEKTNLDSTERIAMLKEQIKQLSDRTDQVSKDATNLARALKGDYKQQGNWGEIILESILEKSGLEKDREYFTQNTMHDDEGRIKRPDVIIKLPDNKNLIIDSKVSLSAYDQIIAATTDEEAKKFSKAHSIAIRNHVDGLAAKNYHDLYKMESPDFVMMFIPIDTAFSVSLQEEPGMYAYAFEKNVVIVTSSTLLATLKTIDTMWKNEKYNRNALKIADEAGKMYDKFEGFLNNFKKIGTQLNTVQNSYHLALKQMSTGTGNLLGRARKVKKLGAKASKQIDYNDYGYLEEE